MTRTLVIWQFTDGKPGHSNQVKGLIKAIMNRTTVVTHSIDVPKNWADFLVSLLTGKFFRTLSKLNKPDYLLAAGNSTHLPMLLAKCKFGGKSILLMRSNWPLRWFDLAIIPEHDQPRLNNSTLATLGVINNIQPSEQHNPSRGIILVGGPSQHFNWNTDLIIQQIQTIVTSSPDMNWTIANSRRTPSDFFEKLNLINKNLSCIDHTSTSSEWLPEQLAECAYVWVTPDSVSMLYEAVTSGAAVGCLKLDKLADNRIVKGIENLINLKMVNSYQQWQTTQHLALPLHKINEAQRAADWILSHD